MRCHHTQVHLVVPSAGQRVFGSRMFKIHSRKFSFFRRSLSLLRKGHVHPCNQREHINGDQPCRHRFGVAHTMLHSRGSVLTARTLHVRRGVGSFNTHTVILTQDAQSRLKLIFPDSLYHLGCALLAVTSLPSQQVGHLPANIDMGGLVPATRDLCQLQPRSLSKMFTSSDALERTVPVLPVQGGRVANRHKYHGNSATHNANRLATMSARTCLSLKWSQLM
jgi:hypothetical protein